MKNGSHYRHPGTVQHELFRHVVNRYGRLCDAADAWGISTSFLSAVLCGRKRITDTLLSQIGWERIVTYQPKADVERGR